VTLFGTGVVKAGLPVIRATTFSAYVTRSSTCVGSLRMASGSCVFFLVVMMKTSG